MNSLLTHEPDRFSDDAWDLLLSGQDVAASLASWRLDVEHLIQALFTDPRFPAPGGALALPSMRSSIAWRMCWLISPLGEPMSCSSVMTWKPFSIRPTIRRRWNGDVIRSAGSADGHWCRSADRR